MTTLNIVSTFAKKYNKPVDGHAPGLRGELAKKYIDAGISTDHECFTKEEALDKLKKAKQKEDQKKKERPDKIENRPNLEGVLPDEKKKPVKDSLQ